MFIDMINGTFQSGGMNTIFIEKEIGEYMHYLKEVHEGSLQVVKAVTQIGLQPNTSVWVFNEEIMINDDGKLITSQDLVWVKEALYNEISKIPITALIPSINTPLSIDPLVQLMVPLKKCLKHNYIPGLLALGSTLLSFHYASMHMIIGNYKVPITILYGPPETGKSFLLEIILALWGMNAGSIFGSASDSF